MESRHPVEDRAAEQAALLKTIGAETQEAATAAEEEVSTVLGPLPASIPVQQTRDLNDAVHRILVVGLVASTALLLAGLALDVVTARSLPTVTLPPADALARVLELRPSGFLSLGLLVLMFTPVVRVLGSVIVFIWERDRLYTAVTLIVLAVMVISILLGQA